ncbi:hypothetical protein KVE42_07470 [Helicobacter pylori]|nr:hypothetical protein KVE42_07470 [Helicobacter pylori]
MKNFIYQQSANYFNTWAFVYVLRNSNVIDGKQIVFNANNPTQTTFKDCYVIKVRL